MGLSITPLVVFDAQNLLSYIKRFSRGFVPCGVSNEDYTILCTTYNSSVPLFNIEYLRQNRERVIICDDGSKSPVFTRYLEELKKEFIVVTNGKKRFIKWHLLSKTLEYVKTKYVVFLDDDSIPKGDIGKAVQVLEEQNADLSSVKVLPINHSGILQNLQNMEYHFAMLTREFRPWLTSGACMIGTTKLLKEIMASHSFFHQGGDIEVGIIARRLRRKVIYVRFVVETRVPSKFKEWFVQRSKWMSGNFRHTIINCPKCMFDPFYVFYFTGMLWMMLLFKWLSNFTSPLLILCILTILYVPFNILANWKIIRVVTKESYWYTFLLFPIYSLFQVLILPFVGMMLYFVEVKKFKSWGVISKCSQINNLIMKEGQEEQEFIFPPLPVETL